MGGLGMDVVKMKCEAHGHVLNSLLLSLMLASTTLVHTGVCDAAACDAALVHVSRLVLASGGLSGVARVIGGGASQAYVDLGTDIALGLPLGKTASWASWLLPVWLLMPFLRLVQLCLWPLQLLKDRVRRITCAIYRPFCTGWDESPAGIATFEAHALSQVCALETLALDTKQKQRAKSGGA